MYVCVRCWSYDLVCVDGIDERVLLAQMSKTTALGADTR